MTVALQDCVLTQKEVSVAPATSLRRNQLMENPALQVKAIRAFSYNFSYTQSIQLQFQLLSECSITIPVTLRVFSRNSSHRNVNGAYT